MAFRPFATTCGGGDNSSVEGSFRAFRHLGSLHAGSELKPSTFDRSTVVNGQDSSNLPRCGQEEASPYRATLVSPFLTLSWMVDMSLRTDTRACSVGCLLHAQGWRSLATTQR